MSTKAPILSTVALALALAGCASMAPPAETPTGAMPATWPTGVAYAPTSGAQTPAPVAWNQFILDTRLRDVVAKALANSRDLRRSVAAIEAARAQYRVQRAGQLPAVSASLEGSRSGGASSSTSQSVSAGVGLSAYEVDLFGRVKSMSDSALQAYLASEEGARATQVSLVAETAGAWLAFAADQERLEVARKTAESAQQSMTLTQRRQELGVSTRLELRQAETVYQQARADVAQYTTAVAQDRNALELLVGAPVEDALLPATLPESAKLLAAVPVGLSSEVLLKRPDVLQAEHQLLAANADIGAARAALFPRVTLTASGGLASTALAGLFTGGASWWSLLPAITLPIFDGGAGRANVAASEAQQKQSLASYELALQTAFKEVADALARRGTMQEQLDAQTALVEASADSYRLADARYRGGAASFLDALDAQRTLYSAQQGLVGTRLTSLDNQITLYRALGGGLGGEQA